jgi:hypothetical protein
MTNITVDIMKEMMGIAMKNTMKIVMIADRNEDS